MQTMRMMGTYWTDFAHARRSGTFIPNVCPGRWWPAEVGCMLCMSAHRRESRAAGSLPWHFLAAGMTCHGPDRTIVPAFMYLSAGGLPWHHPDVKLTGSAAGPGTLPHTLTRPHTVWASAHF